MVVKRASDLSHLLSQPIRYDGKGPLLREMFVGFCLTPRLDPNYHESDPDTTERVSSYLCELQACGQLLTYMKFERYFRHQRGDSFVLENYLPQASRRLSQRPLWLLTVVPQHLWLPTVWNECHHPKTRKKWVWLPELNGGRRVLKCWTPDLDELWVPPCPITGFS